MLATLRRALGITATADGLVRMADRLDSLERECERLAALAAAHDATAAKAVMAADLAQRAERRAAQLAGGAAWQRGVGDGRRVGLEDDLETLDT